MHLTIKPNTFSFKCYIFLLQIKGTLYIFFKTPWHKRLRLSGFVFGLWVLSLFGWRLAFKIRSCYFWFRYVDDIIDGDLKCKGEIKQFRNSKKELLKNLHDKESLKKMKLEEIDWLLIDVYYSCLSEGYDNQESMITLFKALEYDFDRILQKKKFFTQLEIREYFDNLDIPSVIMTLQLINEKKITLKDLEALIDATRIRYNIRDFIEDLTVGIVNVPIEEIEKYGIDIEQCGFAKNLEEAVVHAPFKHWMIDQIAYIEERLAEGKKMVKEKPLRLRTYVTLTLSFIRPCEENLKKWKSLLA